MQEDDEGFLYPRVNESNCINCGLCEKVCHELHPFEEQAPLNAFAAINKDETIRLNSSSGGIFYLLAQKTISEGGVVFGARFDEQWQVVIDHAETMEDVKKFMRSKYVQARMETAYSDAKQFLLNGRKVLFSGTPCQIAGLLHFLRKPYENLLTVDIICHGVPSPKVWERYLNEIVTEGKKAIHNVQHRQELNDWKKNNFTIQYNHGDATISLFCQARNNHYLRAFTGDLILRPSCHCCQAKKGKSHSDITIADYWGVEKEVPTMDDDKGTGLVLINTEKGEKTFENINAFCQETNATNALRHNHFYSHSVTSHPKRTDFFLQLDKEESCIKLINECLAPNFKTKVRLFPSFLKQQVKRMLTSSMGMTEQYPDEFLLSSATPSAIAAISFRNKNDGWRANRMEIRLK